jgi:hypothetical protein
MTTNTPTLSPQARDLIDRTIDWLTPKGRWAKTWAKFKVGKKEIELDEMEDLFDRNFRSLTVEEEINDGWDYIESQPLEDYKGDPQASCLVGSLIVNNGYKNDATFREAVLFLNNLTQESARKGRICEKEEYGYHFCDCSKCEPFYEEDFDVAVENLVSLNDDNKYTHKRHVLNLFRKALKRS